MGCNLVFDRVLTGQPAGWPGHTGSWIFLFFYQPNPVPAPGRPVPRSTRQAEPSFKTMP